MCSELGDIEHMKNLQEQLEKLRIEMRIDFSKVDIVALVKHIRERKRDLGVTA